MSPLEVVGTWRLSRTVEDRLVGDVVRVEGTLVLEVVGEGHLRWREDGVMVRGAHRAQVQRTLAVRRRDDGWWVLFDDGRDFHPWEPGRTVTHLCGRDTYDGTVALPAPDPTAEETTEVTAWSVRWDVSGPAKDYTMRTDLTRL